MHRARLLAALNRQLLEAYSRRTAAALRAQLPLPLALPWLDTLLLSNVEKEVRKDAQVIRSAMQAVRAGEQGDAVRVAALLQTAREIDRDFLAKARSPLEIPIRYEAVNPVRSQRMQRQLAAVSSLCAVWSPRCKLRDALQYAFPEHEFERLLFDLLRLYARETQALGESVRMPALLSPLRRRVLTALYATMEKTAQSLAREAAGRISRPKPARAVR
jgi:hypothetical protein